MTLNLVPEEHLRRPYKLTPDEIITIIEHADNIENSVLWIKHFLTKTIRMEDIPLEDHLEKLINLSDTGIRLINEGKTALFSKKCIAGMHSHLFGYRANLAKKLFDSTGNPIWGEERYHSQAKAAFLSAKNDSRYSMFAFNFLADAAQEMCKIPDLTQHTKHLWTRRWFWARIKSAEKGLEHSIKHAYHSYSLAAKPARQLLNLTQDYFWGKELYNTLRSAAVLSETHDQKFSMYALAMLSDATENMAYRTNDKNWGRKWYFARLKSASLGLMYSKKHAIHSFSIAGKAAKFMAKLTTYPTWIERWIFGNQISAELAKDSNPRHAAFAWAHAGDGYQAKYRQTQDQKVKNMAIDCYEKSLAYFRNNPEPFMQGKIRAVRYLKNH